jgi:3-oxoacyl-(acyl-carrier-protein) synthase
VTGAGLGASRATPSGWPSGTEGIRRTFRRALADAAIDPSEVSAVSAAANGGRMLDAVEARAYAEIFTAGPAPWITSVKGALGESFSGGGIRACALALSVEKGCLPPTVGLTRPITGLPLVWGEKRETGIRHAVQAGISFGGTYAYLVFSRYES